MRSLRPLACVACLLASLLLGGCPEQPPAPPTPSYSIHLSDVGPDASAVVACVVSIRRCTPQLAEGLIKRKGARTLLIQADVSKAAGEQGVAALEAAGAKANLVKIR